MAKDDKPDNYKVISSNLGFTGGNYKGTPKRAAEKAGRYILRSSKYKGNKSVTFTLRRTTQKKPHNEYDCTVKMIPIPKNDQKSKIFKGKVIVADSLYETTITPVNK